MVEIAVDCYELSNGEKRTRGSELDEGTGMEAQGDEGTVRHRRKFVVLGTALPAASEARHSGHRLAPTGKGLPTRLPRSGLVVCLACSIAWG
jgi:hypothetical protein